MLGTVAGKGVQHRVALTVESDGFDAESVAQFAIERRRGLHPQSLSSIRL